MKRLFLIRHAKSSWDDTSLADIDRPLNARGLKAAPMMGKRLRERAIHPDFMITSPALRATATCTLIADKLGFADNKIKIEPALYHASDAQILQVVRQVPDRKDAEEVVFLFGHNPGLTEFANRLLGERLLNIPTCGVVEAEVHVPHWADTAWGCGKLISFDFPKKPHA
jgi:phosphohistidine phosphatase